MYDLRHSIRAVARAKGTTAVLLLSLGLECSVYSVLDRLLLRYPAGIDGPSELVSLYTSEYSGFACGPIEPERHDILDTSGSAPRDCKEKRSRNQREHQTGSTQPILFRRACAT